MIFIITAESVSERILKIGQHLPKLWAIKYRVVFLWNTVYIRIFLPGGGAVRAWQYLRIYSPGGTCSGMLATYAISNKLTFDLLTLKVVSESRVTWSTSVPILVFLALSVLDLGPMYATDRPDVRQTDVR